MRDIAGALTAPEIDAFRRDGLFVPRHRLAPARLEMLRAALDRLIADNPGIRPEQLISAHITRGNTENVRGHEAFLELAHDPAILDMVEQLIGPDIILWGCQVFCKPPGDGQEVPWHQDGRYWPIRPMATVTAWVALDDATTENGCMRFLPGSHRAGRSYRHRADERPDVALDLSIDDDLGFSAARDVVLAAGQMSLHDVFVVHGSNANRSTKRRAGVAIRYMPAGSHFDRAMYEPRTLPNGLQVDYRNRPIWLLRGRDASGRNDFTIGHGALAGPR
ncbi:MAG TPA: phytanoyl-CoA dioxygenase family protein [Candidatus Acidoferrum sp.]|nr:phytanoyl-CoA dioxygenase family protein [Candidatus Acidoferrum sp.]